MNSVYVPSYIHMIKSGERMVLYALYFISVKNVSEVDSTKRRNMVRDADGGLRFNLVRSEKERGFSAKLSRHRRGEKTDDRNRSRF